MSAHWREYAIEGTLLGLFMISACAWVALLEHPASPVHAMVPDAPIRRGLIGLAMGITAVALMLSPLGKRSGAHMNPAVTLTFLRLGKIAPRDALCYALAQCLGAIAGVALAAHGLGHDVIAHPAVHWVATVPGTPGPMAAFMAEAAISFLLLSVVLEVSNRPRWNRWTPWCAGILVAAFIFIEAPLSGMSMNPARTLGSALPAGTTAALWIYFAAPPLGMLLAAEVYLHRRGHAAILCCKLHHDNDAPCIFRCRYPAGPVDTRPAAPAAAGEVTPS